MSPVEILAISIAGLLAGMANAIAGGGTLISFPVLLSLGLPPVTANITSAVGLSSGYLGGVVGYRRELAGQRSRILALIPFAVLGGGTGAALLLVVPASVFHTLVPFLVLASCLLMALQPTVAKSLQRRAQRRQARSLPLSSAGAIVGEPMVAHPAFVRIGIFVASIYGAYFGAGLGVLLLAVLGIFIEDSLQRLNAFKAILSLAINLVSVGIFVFSGRVVWLAAAILFVTAYVGGVLGARIARRLPPAVLRWCVILFGGLVATVLLVENLQ